MPTLAVAPTGVFGLQKMIAAYTGACLRVRRSTDGAEQDIGFNGQDVDRAALASFVGGATGYVSALYDQSGFNNHLLQPDTSRQPFFYTGLGDLAILLIGNSYFLIPASLGGDRSACSMFSVMRDTRQAESQAYWYMGSNSTVDVGLAANLSQYGVQPYTSDGGLGAISPNDGSSDATSSKCVLGFVSSFSGLTVHRDSRTVLSAPLGSRTMISGGFYGRTDANIARQDFFAFAVYPAGLSASDAASLKSALANLFRTNDYWSHPLNIMMRGDSKTYGVSTPFNATPTRQLDHLYGGAALIRNFGIEGHTIQQDLAAIVQGAGKYLESGKTNITIISYATNDLANGRTAAQIWSDYATACAALRAAGWNKVVATTITPRAISPSGFNAAMEIERIALNAMLLANPGRLFDTVANYGAISALGIDGAPNLGYLPDGLHESEAAYALEAQVLKAAIDAAGR